MKKSLKKILSKQVSQPRRSKKPYVFIRSSNSGVFAGYLISKKGNELVIDNSRRIWKWAGAASLSDLAVNGVTQPEDCLFPPEIVKGHILNGWDEIIPASEKARKSIEGTKVWTMHE